MSKNERGDLEPDGEPIERLPDDAGDDVETGDCACSTLPGDYPCAACYIDGSAEWPDGDE